MARELSTDIEQTAKMLAKEDIGQPRSGGARRHGYQGYTSYSSLDDLVQRATCFDDLLRLIKPHAEKFSVPRCRWICGGKKAEARQYLGQRALEARRLALGTTSIRTAFSPGRILCARSPTAHRRSQLLKTLRLPMMMAAPSASRGCGRGACGASTYRRRRSASATFSCSWESWLRRREVPPNRRAAASSRISVSFNFRKG